MNTTPLVNTSNCVTTSGTDADGSSHTGLQIVLGGASLSGPLTGIGQYTWHLMQSLAALGVQSHVFANARWRPQAFAKQFSVNTDAEPAPAKSNMTTMQALRKLALKLPLTRPLADTVQAWRFRAGISNKMALYHEPNFIPLAYNVLPTVITAHDASWVRYPETHPPQRVAHMTKHFGTALRRADKIIVVSNFVRQELLSLFNVDPEKIRVVHNGVSPRFRPVSPNETASYTATLALQSKSYFLALGTLEPRKRLITALQAHQRLPMEIRRRYPLVIAGQKGWLLDDFEKIVAGDLSNGTVRMLGYVSDHDLPNLVSSALATMYCSVYEGFGLPPLESMACGVLPICSDRSAMPEVVADAGVLLDPDNIEGFTEAMRRAIDDAAWMEHMSKLAIARASQFSWIKCATETLDVYREALICRA